MNTTTFPQLRDSIWAGQRLGYKMPEQRFAFWQFCDAHNVPMIRMGPRRIRFDEQQIADWIASHSTGGR